MMHRSGRECLETDKRSRSKGDSSPHQTKGTLDDELQQPCNQGWSAHDGREVDVDTTSSALAGGRRAAGAWCLGALASRLSYASLAGVVTLDDLLAAWVGLERAAVELSGALQIESTFDLSKTGKLDAI